MVAQAADDDPDIAEVLAGLSHQIMVSKGLLWAHAMHKIGSDCAVAMPRRLP